MKTIKNSKEITTLEVGDKVLFGDLTYEVHCLTRKDGCIYFLYGLGPNTKNNTIFITLGLSAANFVKNLGIEISPADWIFPEVKSLEALTAIVSALFKEYEKQKKLPTTWEEFCAKNTTKKGECYIGLMSHITTYQSSCVRMPNVDRNICISKQEAEAFLALNQLRQLRKAYVKDWEPDWSDSSYKYCVNFYNDESKIDMWEFISHVLSFPTKELAEQFLTNFKDLIEIAKPLL